MIFTHAIPMAVVYENDVSLAVRHAWWRIHETNARTGLQYLVLAAIDGIGGMAGWRDGGVVGQKHAKARRNPRTSNLDC